METASSTSDSESTQGTLVLLSHFFRSLTFLTKDSAKHYGITCDACKKTDFTGHRYKCTVCEDVDLCAVCYEDREIFGSHGTHHPVLLIRDPKQEVAGDIQNLLNESSLEEIQNHTKDAGIVHPLFCDGCGANPIKGVRLKCDDCAIYDLCYDCFKSRKATKSHKTSHSLIFYLVTPQTRVEFDDIQFSAQLGEGAFGKVYKGTLDGEQVAIKVTEMIGMDGTIDICQFLNYPEQRKTLENEIRNYQEFNCNYIVTYIGYAVSDHRIALLLELMDKTLEEVIHRGSYDQVSLRKRFGHSFDIIRGLERIHRKGIVHKDLKLDNIFVSEYATKLGDLGISFNPENYTKTVAAFRQKEYYLIFDVPEETSYDIYAFGLIFVEIMTGVKNTKLKPEEVASKTQFFSSLIQRCLSKNATERPTAQEIKTEFKSFQKYWDSYLETSDIQYTSLPVQERNNHFRKIYAEFMVQQSPSASCQCSIL